MAVVSAADDEDEDDDINRRCEENEEEFPERNPIEAGDGEAEDQPIILEFDKDPSFLSSGVTKAEPVDDKMGALDVLPVLWTPRASVVAVRIMIDRPSLPLGAACYFLQQLVSMYVLISFGEG